MSADDKLRCPGCGGADIRHSLPRGLLDSFMMVFRKTPFRCRRCERRFYRHAAIPSLANDETETEESLPGQHP